MQSWLRGGGRTPFALCLVRQWIHVLRLLWGAFGRFFFVFAVLGSEVDSVLLSRVGGHARRRPWLWYVLTGFAWLLCTSPCVPFGFAGLRMEKLHRRCFGCLFASTWKLFS